MQKMRKNKHFSSFFIAKKEGMWYSVGYISYKEEETV